MLDVLAAHGQAVVHPYNRTADNTSLSLLDRDGGDSSSMPSRSPAGSSRAASSPDDEGHSRVEQQLEDNDEDDDDLVMVEN